jgi:uncharacterized membrane protein YGL010W
MAQTQQLRPIDAYFDKYAESHQNKINKTIHWIAVPLIVFSLLGLIWAIPMPDFMKEYPYFNWASLLIAFALYYYYKLSPMMAFTMMLMVGIMSYFIVQLEHNQQNGGWAMWQVCLAIFAGAWILQFIGHKIEGKKPSFLDDVRFLLIGPIWLIHFIFKKIGLRY